MKKMLIAVVIVILIVVGVFIFFKKGDKAPQYETASPERGDIRAMVSATGTVNPVTTILIGTQVSGTIKELFVDFNDVVRKGQLLAQIDPSSFEAQMAQASANLSLALANLEKSKVALRNAKTTFERNSTLFEKNFISRSDLDASETAYLSAEAQIKASEAQVLQARAALELSQTNLRYTRILSPVNGTVISRNVDVGQTVAASFQTPTLFSIAQDLKKMQINTSVDEADIGAIKKHQPVFFTVDAYPDITFRGKVSEVRNSPTMVQNVVTYDVIVDVNNSELRLKPGMTANVSIILADKKDVLRVPNAALRLRMPDKALAATAPKGPGVWVLDDKTPKRVLLKLGIRDGRFTEVLSGDISEQSRLIVDVKSDQPSSSSSRPPGPGFMR